MRITDQAVDAALYVLLDHGHSGIKCYDPQPGLDATAREALEAALPHLEGATPAIDRDALDALFVTHGVFETTFISTERVESARRILGEAVLALIGRAP